MHRVDVMSGPPSDPATDSDAILMPQMDTGIPARPPTHALREPSLTVEPDPGRERHIYTYRAVGLRPCADRRHQDLDR